MESARLSKLCEQVTAELDVECEAHEATQEMTRQMMKQWAEDMQSYKEQTLNQAVQRSGGFHSVASHSGGQNMFTTTTTTQQNV